MSSKPIRFNIASINKCTEAEGPGKRLAIWFQGCKNFCEDCCNPELKELKKANIVSFSSLKKIIVQARLSYGIDGVTFLGGEPTLQKGLFELALFLRKQDLGTILFTGERYESFSADFISAFDLIIDGPYDKKNKEKERNLIGSTNQRLLFITERYKKDENWFFDKRPKKIEINVSQGLVITGDVCV